MTHLFAPIPARAGMNRASACCFAVSAADPRTGGDEPLNNQYQLTIFNRSPHGRG